MMLEIKKLYKKYNNNTVLQNVQLQINKGSCFGLVGPNGAGKSTLIKILAGIIQADRGSVMMDQTKGIGYIPQEICLEERLSASDNLTLFGKIYGLRGTTLQKHVEEVLQLIGLEHRKNDKVQTFSGGMKRRLHIGCSLIHRPNMILMDEPTVGVDPQSRQYIFDLLQKLTSSGTTIIYATHYMEEVEQLCDAVAFIDEGKIIETNKLTTLLHEYALPQVFVEGLDILPVFPNDVDVFEKNDGFLLTTDQPFAVMEMILQKQKKEKVEIKRLELVQPRLADIFLRLTGTHLRD